MERKLLFGVEDLKGLTLECLTCSARVRVPLEKLQTLPLQCPVCGTTWLDPSPASRMMHESPYLNFAFALRRLREIVKQGGGMAFKIWLEFDDPERQ